MIFSMLYFRVVKITFLLCCLLVCVLIVSCVLCIHKRTSFIVNDSKSVLPGSKFGRSIYLERLDNLNKVCQRYTAESKVDLLQNKQVLDHILVDPRHQLLYCYVPKVACTNWKRMLMILSGLINTTDVLSIPADLAHSRNALASLANFTTSHAAYLLSTYTKFLFVRHPFERLVSAFRNKLEPNLMRSKYFQSRIGKYIAKRYRTKSYNSSDHQNEYVTFEEFISYLTQNRGTALNEHWQTIENLCSPCSISYDFIGKYETLSTDSDFLLNAIGVSNLIFPAGPRMRTTTDHLSMYFRRISPSVVKELYRIYEMDFKLFSYDLTALFGYEIS